MSKKTLNVRCEYPEHGPALAELIMQAFRAFLAGELAARPCLGEDPHER